MRQRRLAFQPASALPPEVAVIRDPRLLATDAAIWLVDQRNGTVLVVAPTGDWPAVQADFAPVVWPQPPALPLASAQAGPSGLVLTDKTGAVWAAAPQATVLTPQQGAPLSGTVRPVAVAGAGDGLLLTDGQSIWVYTLSDRSWSGPIEFGLTEEITDIMQAPDALLALTESGRVWRIGDNQTWEPLSGGRLALRLGFPTLPTQGKTAAVCFSAGMAWWPAAHPPADRAFMDAFTGGSGDVRIVGGDGTSPLWLSDGVANAPARSCRPRM